MRSPAATRNGAHGGKPGKDEEVNWENRKKEQSPVPIHIARECFRHYYVDAGAIFMLIAFVFAVVGGTDAMQAP